MGTQTGTVKACLHCTLNAHSMHIDRVCTANEKNQTGSNAHGANPLLEVDWKWIESGLEWNVSICVVACLHFRPT